MARHFSSLLAASLALAAATVPSVRAEGTEAPAPGLRGSSGRPLADVAEEVSTRELEADLDLAVIDNATAADEDEVEDEVEDDPSSWPNLTAWAYEEEANFASSSSGEDEDPLDVALSAEVLAAGGLASCPHSDQVRDPSKDCAASENYDCAGCYLYHACKGRSVCIMNGYLVVPGAPMRGMEDISSGTAGRWDYLWDTARGACGSDSCVLISNPVHYRTQHQMHLHFRHINSGGYDLKRQLEGTLCGTSGWRYFSKCGSAKARLYDSMPRVFTEVARAYGGGSLANVGITVWFTSACGGGQKVMLLDTTYCSIEHSISSR